ncbi:MAG: inositol-3-phosphate synthase [Bacteroidetes bacterium]|nr:MAG: inositol-3-phosphate synthase [Bacteroidota bacterium]
MTVKKLKSNAHGKLGVLLPGLGAIATTYIAGVIATNKGLGNPIGSFTQNNRIRLGKRTENRNPIVADFVPLAKLNDLVFGGWDIFEDDTYEAAKTAGVLENNLLDQLRDEMEQIKPMKAVFDKEYVQLIDGPNVKSGETNWDLMEALMDDIKNFKEKNNCDRLVMIWTGSTEKYVESSDVHQSIEAFEAGLKNNDPRISPSMIYGYAAVKSGVPFANGSPNLAADTPALVELANKLKVPIGGKDLKTGQTLMKTILAPGLKARSLGIEGWFSTNILGNRDGQVLDHPDNFKTKEVSKLSVLDSILEPETHPELYKDLYHKVRINYYPPRGDNKEGWDNIDIFGWLGYKMQIKIDFLCKDSILAAPLLLDITLLLDLAQRAEMFGIQEWLSFFFKAPQTKEGLTPIHDIFLQKVKLENTLRHLMGENLITHLGLDYYEE